ncbi:MAG TPA: hypothetical protein VHJ18_21570 [Streptosporangiaceae bacterium]|nr:hypothetical protein [Streptosporangiaceae bacterium]
MTRIRPAERATDRTAALCATTVRLGIDERPYVRIGEAQGQTLAECIDRILRRLDIRDDPRVPVVVPEEMRRMVAEARMLKWWPPWA